MRDGLERLGQGAPRLRMAALVLVGVIVAGLMAFALLRPGPVVGEAETTLDGRLCAVQEGRVWTSADTVVAPGEELTIEGVWTDTGAQTAELTTAAGRRFELQTLQPEGDRLRFGFACDLKGP